MVITSGKKVAKDRISRIVSLGFLTNGEGKTEFYSENCQSQNKMSFQSLVFVKQKWYIWNGIYEKRAYKIEKNLQINHYYLPYWSRNSSQR